MDGQRHAVRHAVRDAQELQREVADRDAITRPHGREPVAGIDAVLGQLGFHHRQRQRRAVDRPLDGGQDVRQRPDVIFVAVGENDRRVARRALLDIRDVRDDEIDTEQLRLGKHGARIHDDHRVRPGDGHHVQAEFSKPPERHDLELGLGRFRRYRLFGHRVLIDFSGVSGNRRAIRARTGRATGIGTCVEQDQPLPVAPAPGEEARRARHPPDPIRWAVPARSGPHTAAGKAFKAGGIKPRTTGELYHRRVAGTGQSVRKFHQFHEMQAFGPPGAIDARLRDERPRIEAARGRQRLERIGQRLAPLSED